MFIRTVPWSAQWTSPMVATLVIKQWVNEVMKGVEELMSSIAEDPSMNKEQLYQTSAIQDPALGVEAHEVGLLMECCTNLAP